MKCSENLDIHISCCKCKRGGLGGGRGGGSALKILIYNVPYLIMRQTLSDRVLTIETLNCVNDLRQ